MKILKIFGVVVGVHVFALILIFANPGCSSSATKSGSNNSEVSSAPTPAPVEDSSPVVVASAPASESLDTTTPSPVIRFSPTRPGTPAASALETAATPVTDVTPATTYTVVKGDSLWTIARKHHLTVSELAAANNLSASAPVRVGQRLLIPSKPSSVAADPAVSAPSAREVAATPQPQRESVRHVVKPGETLGAIARKYQVKVGEIATINNIADPARIRPGMELSIPGWKAPGNGGTSAARTSEAAPAATTPAQPQPQRQPASDPVPTIVIPAPGDDLDSGLQPSPADVPVIQVEENPGNGF